MRYNSTKDIRGRKGSINSQKSGGKFRSHNQTNDSIKASDKSFVGKAPIVSSRQKTDI
jgi:hypothetical protein